MNEVQTKLKFKSLDFTRTSLSEPVIITLLSFFFLLCLFLHETSQNKVYICTKELYCISQCAVITKNTVGVFILSSPIHKILDLYRLDQCTLITETTIGSIYSCLGWHHSKHMIKNMVTVKKMNMSLWCLWRTWTLLQSW